MISKKEAIKNRNVPPIYVGINEIMGMFSIGRSTAEKIGFEINAIVKLGKNKVYNIEKFKAYFEKMENENA